MYAKVRLHALACTMLTLAIFGASGRTGWRVCEYARDAGYALRILARNPTRLGAAHAGADVITGDVLDAEAVGAVVQGADAIISALGADDFRSPGDVLSSGMANIVAAAKRHDVSRILAVAGGGILDAAEGGLRSERPGFPAAFAAMTLQHQGTWRALRESGLAWTLACTPDLTEDVRTGIFRAVANAMPDNGRRIARDELAHWLVAQIECTTFVNMRVGLAT